MKQYKFNFHAKKWTGSFNEATNKIPESSTTFVMGKQTCTKHRYNSLVLNYIYFHMPRSYRKQRQTWTRGVPRDDTIFLVLRLNLFGVIFLLGKHLEWKFPRKNENWFALIPISNSRVVCAAGRYGRRTTPLFTIPNYTHVRASMYTI